MAVTIKGNPYTHIEEKRESKVNYMPWAGSVIADRNPNTSINTMIRTVRLLARIQQLMRGA